MNRVARYGILIVSIVIVGWVGVGHVLGRTANDKAYKSLQVYSEVLQKIQQDYVDEPNMHLVTTGSLHGLLESLDSESSYLTPREYTEYKEKTANPGTGESGLNLSKRSGYIVVISVLLDSPAEKAGLRSGDFLESIAGFTTREMSVGQAKNLLAGQPGTAVKVGVIRRGRTDPEEVDIVRQKLVQPKLIVERVENDTLALRFPTLDAGTADEVKAHLVEAQKQGISHVVLDVRDCGRGSDAEAIAVARLFIPSGTLTTLKGQTVAEQVFTADPTKVVWKGPVSVLTDVSSAGAAEVLASAFANTKRGAIVGERTFGLASEQKLIPLEDGAAIVLTVANYYNADGKSILEEGVIPTEVVQASSSMNDDGDDGEDSGTTAGAQKEPPAGPKPLSPDDPVLRKALELFHAPAQAKKAA
ncbi:MAG TPA: S41 family peptidase [Candidatus Eremiobacteraceae bacterium]|nr:S41 family peptidase [Candidatus Eremiobacteraceae bacterium]